jgi:polysaccharide biosynthesis transport protein
MSNDLVHYGARSVLPPSSVAANSGRQNHEDGDDDTTPVDWQRRLWAVWRFKWLVVLTAALGTAVGVYVSPRIRPAYEVKANVWISSPTPSQQPRSDGPIRAEELLASTSWASLFRSFTVVDSVVLAMRSYISTPVRADASALDSLRITSNLIAGSYALKVDQSGRRYTLTRSSDGRIVETGVVGDSIGRKIGIAWHASAAKLTPNREIDFHVTRPRSAALALLDSLQADLPQNGNFLQLTLKGGDPYEAAATLNLWVKQFVATATALKKRNVSETTRIIADQLRFSERQLRDADNALQTFRVRTITLPSEETPIVPGLESTRGPVFDAFFKLKIEYDNVRRDREALKSIADGIAAGKMSADAIASIPGILTTPGAEKLAAGLAELRKKEADLRADETIYTPENQIVKTAIAEINALQRQTIPGYANEVLSELGLREAELDRRITAESKEMQDIPTRTIEEAKLRREVSLAENLYTSLQTRYDAARLQEASLVPDVSALDMAAPPDAPKTNTKLIIRVAGAAGGVALGIALAILFDAVDVRFRYLSQVQTVLGLPVYGSVPVINKRKMHDPVEQSQLVEAFRSLRLQLHRLSEQGEPIVFAVTSTMRSDGKSTVSQNLALSFAEGGYRTLLIDADTRCGNQHDVFGLSRCPGLIDQLTHRASLDEVLRPSGHERLTILTCGARERTNPQVVAGVGFPKLLTELRSAFDVIIVDTPPLGAGADAFALGVAAGHVLLVLRHGTSDLKMVQAKLDVLRRLPVQSIGAVLNGIRAQGAFKYYTAAPIYYAEAYDTDVLAGGSSGQLTGGD